MAGELKWVAVDLVGFNPFGEQFTDESLQTILHQIGTVKQWTEHFGLMCGHDASITDNVARLLTEGVKHWNFQPPMWHIYNICPEATPASWWILLCADNKKDKQLCSKLAICAENFHPFVWNEVTTRAWSAVFLQAVKAEMTAEAKEWLREQYRAYDAYAAGAGPVAG
jgi:hypothetical protein